jgi:HCOMODA/2-hydroxy-3-carboxy-muconic semialdehyde decarboxylase
MDLLLISHCGSKLLQGLPYTVTQVHLQETYVWPFQAPPSDLVDRLVYANRILYDQGIVDGLGHVSVRHPTQDGVFLLSCNRAPGLVKRQDIVCYDLDGNAVSDTTERPYLERFIHSEIYRARPDVVAVVRSHSPSVIPFAITHNPLKPVFHMSGFLGSGSAHFEIREAAGNSDMLIRSAYLGEALAKSLGKHNCVLMRGHGSTVVGSSSGTSGLPRHLCRGQRQVATGCEWLGRESASSMRRKPNWPLT